MPDYEFDVVVIGTGPGGEGAAMQAAKHGLKVVEGAKAKFAAEQGGVFGKGQLQSRAVAPGQGGGHRFAAGFTSDLDVPTLVARIIAAL